MEMQSIEAYIFYFDIVEVVRTYQKGIAVEERIAAFQRDVRKQDFPTGNPFSMRITIADNVWARIASTEPIAKVIVLDFATATMKIAEKHGFNAYFGVCTFGVHKFNLIDRTIITADDPTQIICQHIQTISEPQIRAAVAEKFSARLKEDDRLEFDRSCVWISEEVETCDALHVTAGRCGFKVLADTFDLDALSVGWSFPGRGRFTPIGVDRKNQ